MNINLDSLKLLLLGIKLFRVSSYSALLVSRVAIKLDCKDTRSHIYAHISSLRLRGEGGEITQEK